MEREAGTPQRRASAAQVGLEKSMLWSACKAIKLLSWIHLQVPLSRAVAWLLQFPDPICHSMWARQPSNTFGCFLSERFWFLLVIQDRIHYVILFHYAELTLVLKQD